MEVTIYLKRARDALDVFPHIARQIADCHVEGTYYDAKWRLRE